MTDASLLGGRAQTLAAGAKDNYKDRGLLKAKTKTTTNERQRQRQRQDNGKGKLAILVFGSQMTAPLPP